MLKDEIVFAWIIQLKFVVTAWIGFVKVHANEGGVTQTRGGIYWIILPAGFISMYKQSSKIESEDSSITPPLRREYLPRNLHCPVATGKGNKGRNHYYDSGYLTSTPKLSSISCREKTETTSVDTTSVRSISDADRSGELSISVASIESDQEMEWVEKDEPGFYITIRLLPRGVKELCHVRFSTCFFVRELRHVQQVDLLAGFLEKWEKDDDAELVIFKGAGRAFSASGDLKVFYGGKTS